MASGSASNRQASDLALGPSVADTGGFRSYSVMRARQENRVLLVGLLLAILLHAIAILSVLIEWPDSGRLIEPREIPVDLIFEEPPKAEEEQPPVPPPPLRERESGDDSSLAPGQAAEVAPQPTAPEPAPAPSTEAATPAPEPLDEGKTGEFDVPLRKPTPPPPPLPPKPAETPPAPRTAAPSAPTLQQRQPSRLSIMGQGGGDSYLNRLRDLIEKQRSYPVIGNPMHLTGTAIYELRINRAGQIVSIVLLRSSGAGTLDEEGYKMVRRAAPFPPVPTDIPGTVLPLRLNLPIYP